MSELLALKHEGRSPKERSEKTDEKIPATTDTGSYSIENAGAPGVGHQSRRKTLEELQILGVNTETFDTLSIEALAGLLSTVRGLVAEYSQHKKPGRPRSDPSSGPVLTNSDRFILKYLFESAGHVSSLSISRQLDIPLSTIQRRRKRLEDFLIQKNYSLKIELLGWRKATLYASLIGGQSELVGKQILDMSKRVTSVTRTLGNSGLDLQIKVLFKANSELTSLIEQIKSIEGISGVTWCEPLSTIGKNPEVYKQVIEET